MTSARNQHVQRTILLLKMTLTLCLILLAKTAPAAEWIDQSNLPEWGGGWTHVNPTGEGRAAMWQTFTPVCTNVVAVEIDILTINPGRGDDVLTVEIARDGDTLALAERFVEDGFDGLLRFEFPEAVPLVPEQVYELTVRDTGKTRFGWKYGPNTYEQGSRYVFAEERPGSDWFFRTYSNVEPTPAKYSGGRGVPDNPYQIATAEDLMRLGESPEDYDKHFILIADIDLDPNLPGRKVFDKAVIASFTGVFDGKSHTISHLTIAGGYLDYLGLFGYIASSAEVKNLGVEDVNIIHARSSVGGVVGHNRGAVTNCYSIGIVNGGYEVGGLVGENDGDVDYCYSTGSVIAYGESVGGLVGDNGDGCTIAQSYSTATVSGNGNAGGLVGDNYGCVTQCYCAGPVSGEFSVGGLLGRNLGGNVFYSYSTGPVIADKFAGGLIGNNFKDSSAIVGCFWDIQTSGQTVSAAGIGKTTDQMRMGSTFLGWGAYGWTINEGWDYPHLAWEGVPGDVIVDPTYAGGNGTANDPFLIYTPEHLDVVGLAPSHWDKCFKLMADIDMSGLSYDYALIAPDMQADVEDFQGQGFSGVFDGNSHTISHLTITGESYLGLFGQLQVISGAEVKNLGLVDIDIVGSGDYIGALVGENWGIVTACYSTGRVDGGSYVGGLIGGNGGSLTHSYSAGAVSGVSSVGGLAGCNGFYFVSDDVGTLAMCYSTGFVVGSGQNCGGVVGNNASGARGVSVIGCFWDTQTSGQTNSAAGEGKTTIEMQTASTFLEAGWDFVGETANGTEDIWWILERKDYPRLWWEAK